MDNGANKMTIDTLNQWSIKLDNQKRTQQKVIEMRK